MLISINPIVVNMEISLTGKSEAKTIHKRSSSKKELKSSNLSIPNSVRFMYLNVKKRRYVTPPSTKVFTSNPSTSHDLGPGKYSIRGLSRGPSFEFSRVPRFNDRRLRQSLFTNPSKSDVKFRKIIESNKDLSRLTPAERIKSIKESAKKNKIKANITKIAKKHIVQDQKDLKLQNIKEKYAKIEYREKLTEIKKIKKY